jgi:hypothetical protein
MRPSLDLANFLTPEPFPNGDVSNYLKLWEFAPEFASTPSTQGPHGLKLWCGDKFPRAYNSFIKFLNKGREIARELVDVPSCLKTSGYQIFCCQVPCCCRTCNVHSPTEICYCMWEVRGSICNHEKYLWSDHYSGVRPINYCHLENGESSSFHYCRALS